ncbi:hypothetical protein ACHAW6_011133 [Cyclotella cf. meneghiniana]
MSPSSSAWALSTLAHCPLLATAFSAISCGRVGLIRPLPASPFLRRALYYEHPGRRLRSRLRSGNDSDDNNNNNNNKNDNEEESNPYFDPNFPDLEFIDYSDPSYQVDQGSSDEFVRNPSATEEETLAEIEAMRESRRRRNDEYQFETYHASVLREGEIALGEWTVFQTDTFMGPDVVAGRDERVKHVPRLLKWDKELKVVSRGYKVIVDPEAEWRVDGERIVHEETLATADDFPIYIHRDVEEDVLGWEEEDRLHVQNTFWPKELESLDFRGPGGNMCVGKAYTICDAVPLQTNSQAEQHRHEGPFSEMRTELGLTDAGMRFRIKLDYATLENQEESLVPPPLHLRTLTVCRETLDGYWPNPSDNYNHEGGNDMTTPSESTARRKNQDQIDTALFGPPGAPGGLYDPPPVGSEERAIQNYMLLDFEGGATVLLPHRLDQHHENGGENSYTDSFGWVTSLDWTPGKIRYQVDRKVLGGTKLKGLKTLELSEVRGEDADRWRPRDGGANMRQ